MTASTAAHPDGAAVEMFAPAKVNLFLHVTGRRADGYHLLDSLVAFAGVGDSLRLSAAADLSLTLDGPTAGALTADADNIVLKAARLLAAHAGLVPRAALHLTKRLPVAAGIGGGSTDGAAALRGLCALWGLAPSETELEAIGLQLGADVPVCLRGRPTQMAGIGEILTPAPALPPAWLVLVNPGIALSTPTVFKARAAAFSAPAPLTASPATAAALAAALALRGNDLSAPAIALAPVIGAVLQAIEATPDCLLARMSGSGATCFGLFDGDQTARAAAQSLAQAYPAWWVAPAPLVSRPLASA